MFRTLLHIRNVGSSIKNPTIAIVGAGPSGLYTCSSIFRKIPEVTIDVFDRSPVPFGLVRYGVAPDHADVKNCTKQFEKIFETHKNNLSLFCNVAVGEDVTYEELCQNYDAVVLAYGASKSRQLNIPGIDAKNCFAGGDFVSWYNGAPCANEPLLDKKNAVIIGNGNVSIDCARILLQDVEKLRKYDIPNNALLKLQQSSVSEVSLFGRRGPEDTSVTIKEFREFLRLEAANVKIGTDLHYFDKLHVESMPRPKKRIMELMKKHVSDQEHQQNHRKKGLVGFFTSPTRVFKDSNNRIEALEIKNNVTGELSTIECGLLVYAIGFDTFILKDIPQISQKMSMKDFCRVDNSSLSDKYKTYATGWCAHGAKGVIANAQADAHLVSQEIINDIIINDNVVNDNMISDVVKDSSTVKRGVKHLLVERKTKFVDWDDWKELDNEERKIGVQYGKLKKTAKIY
uniref:NADPH:adrenodoxin oxidoreductase, mitochondrial n=1 Tax=Rhabditophanes sp. KR3021 TaxID=114890 RepID=A0AC35UCN5_9BILA